PAPGPPSGAAIRSVLPGPPPAPCVRTSRNAGDAFSSISASAAPPLVTNSTPGSVSARAHPGSHGSSRVTPPADLAQAAPAAVSPAWLALRPLNAERLVQALAGSAGITRRPVIGLAPPAHVPAA